MIRIDSSPNSLDNDGVLPIGHIVSHLLLPYIRGSLEGVLRVAYPSFDFLPWCFNNCPMKYWANIDNQRRYIRWFEKIKHFNSPSDWFAFLFILIDYLSASVLLLPSLSFGPVGLGTL